MWVSTWPPCFHRILPKWPRLCFLPIQNTEMFCETEQQGVVRGTINRTLWGHKEEGNSTSHHVISSELLEILSYRSLKGPMGILSSPAASHTHMPLWPFSHVCFQSNKGKLLQMASESIQKTAPILYSWQKPYMWIFSMQLGKAREVVSILTVFAFFFFPEDWKKTYKLRILPQKGNKVWSRYIHWEDLKSFKISSQAEAIRKTWEGDIVFN